MLNVGRCEEAPGLEEVADKENRMGWRVSTTPRRGKER
jgi:hypothetical protein